MRKLFFWIAAIMLGCPAWCQIEQVGKGVFPENQTFGFSMTPDKKTAFFCKVLQWKGLSHHLHFTMEKPSMAKTNTCIVYRTARCVERH
jgi:hypothetical protein